MSIQAIWLANHLWVPNTNVTILAFSHANDNSLILSSNLGISVTTLLNIRLLRSFHITQVHSSQIKGRDSCFIKGTFWGEDKRGYHALDTWVITTRHMETQHSTMKLRNNVDMTELYKLNFFTMLFILMTMSS